MVIAVPSAESGGCPYVLCQGGRDQCLAFELVDEVMLGSPAGWCCCRLRGRWGQAAVTIGTVGALGGEEKVPSRSIADSPSQRRPARAVRAWVRFCVAWP